MFVVHVLFLHLRLLILELVVLGNFLLFSNHLALDTMFSLHNCTLDKIENNQFDNINMLPQYNLIHSNNQVQKHSNSNHLA